MLFLTHSRFFEHSDVTLQLDLLSAHLNFLCVRSSRPRHCEWMQCPKTTRACLLCVLIRSPRLVSLSPEQMAMCWKMKEKDEPFRGENLSGLAKEHDWRCAKNCRLYLTFSVIFGQKSLQDMSSIWETAAHCCYGKFQDDSWDLTADRGMLWELWTLAFNTTELFRLRMKGENTTWFVPFHKKLLSG